MDDRHAIFRTRLIALMTALNKGESRDPVIRRVIGTYAYRLSKEAGAKNWADLKARADSDTYEALLKFFTEHGAKMHEAGDAKGARGIEALALSLVARRQRQADLVPGVGFLDRFIDSCATLAKPPAKVVVTAPRRTRH